MKKVCLLLTLASVTLISTQSCKKCDLDDHRGPVISNQTIDAPINENTTYFYTFPAGKGNVSHISMPTAHSSVSMITTDTNGNYVFQYTPLTNYTGTDVVVITTEAGAGHGGCFGGNPGSSNYNGQGCNHGNGRQTIITTIDLTVTAAVPSMSARKSSFNNKLVDY